MRRVIYFFLTVVLVITACFATERNAYAYIDPGSSLVLYQGASSIVLGVVYYFRRRLKRLLTFKA